MPVRFGPDGAVTYVCFYCRAMTPKEGAAERGWRASRVIQCPSHACPTPACDVATDRTGQPCLDCRRAFAVASYADAVERHPSTCVGCARRGVVSGPCRVAIVAAIGAAVDEAMALYYERAECHACTVAALRGAPPCRRHVEMAS